MQQITSYEQFQSLIDSQSDRILFKHSGRCSISWGACKQVNIAIEELILENIYQLDVLHTWDLKYQIADFLKIKHESPQVIIFSKGKVQNHANHSSITKWWITNEIIGRHDTRK
jgi:bacillithiol system protein YtxJ